MSRQIGDRVGAIRSADKDTVYLFGYGVYEGDHELPEELALYPGMTNPRMKLDDGTTVFGIESWWGSEKKIRESIGSRAVVVVKPERAEASQ